MKMLKNERGQLTLDFIFAITLVLGFTVMLFMLSFTMTVASIVQYVTFASARMYAVGNIDQATQTSDANAKYSELISNSVFKPLFSNGWYKLDAAPTVGDQSNINGAYAISNQGDFLGVGTHFVAAVLDFKIPFFGSTVPDGDGSGSGFTTYINSFIGREPTEAECVTFTKARWTAIQNMPVNGAAAYNSGGSATYYPMTDDGC